ncbi:hypothetical protein ACOP3E_26030 (plasmid) [Escherichia coli]
MATSGDYRHWRERDGSVFSHTMDPYLGAPLPLIWLRYRYFAPVACTPMRGRPH